MHPNDVQIDDLRWADVVLMDQRLKHWPERDSLETIGLQPMCGVALAAVYREHVDSLGDAGGLTAFAVHSAHLADLAGRLPPECATHVIARMNNIEWAFSKTDPELSSKVAALGYAVRRMPEKWPDQVGEASASLAKKLLGLVAEKKWNERAWDDVLRCQVPLIDLASGGHGLLFIRWLLQSIIPFPTFLWDEHWVSANLRITRDSLRSVVEGDSTLTSELVNVRYQGLLEDFSGSRWWKGGVEQLAWKIRNKGARGTKEFHAALEQMAGHELEPITATSPVVCIDADLRPTGRVVDIEKAVRLVPDLWPTFADEPLAEIDLILENPRLRAVVHPLDTEMLATASDDEDG